MMTRNKFNAGFNLIELLIVIAIIGILVSIAYPSYQNQITQTRRTDAQGVLSGLSNAMERLYSENGTYMPGGAAPSLGATGIFPSQAPLEGTNKYYNLSISASTANTFTARATPITSSAQNGDGFLELDHTGARRWDKNNNGVATDAGENNWD